MKRISARAAVIAVAALVVSVIPTIITSSAEAAAPVTGAVATTVNEAVDGTDHCKNGSPNINCNIYDGKEYVWLSGLPDTAGLNDGTYFFGVYQPGGQGANSDANPNDGTDKNLSDTVAAPWTSGYQNSDGSTAPSGDPYTNRTFTLTNGVISYNGDHDFANNKIRLMPYDDTPNPGGVYIMAVCRISGVELDPEAFGSPGVNPSDCKYDAFKVQEGDDTPQGLPLTVTKDAFGEYTETYTWNIAKDADKTEVNQSATSATFNYTVTVGHDGGVISAVGVNGNITVFNPNVDENDNVVPVSGVNVTDVLSDGTECTVFGGTDVTLTEAETTFEYQCDLASLPTGDLANVVTATWDEQLLDNGNLLQSGTDDFAFENIEFVRTPVDECVSVSDTIAGFLGYLCAGEDANPTVFTYSNVVNGTPGTCTVVDNTATIVETGEYASKSVKLCVGADLTVDKTFDPTFTRTYAWDITKDVDKTEVKQATGSVTFNYTIGVDQTGVTDSDWAGSGIITVYNPNDWQDITANVSDTVDNGGSCTLDDPAQATVTVPAGESVLVPYSCTFPDGDSGINTATATWDSEAYYTPSGSDSGTADVAFTTPSTLVNKTVTVKDTWNGGSQVTLGTVTANDAAPFASRDFTYSKTVAVQYGCVTYNNTAVIVQTGQSANQSVEVCGPVYTGAKTIGFWQNKNGQAIIKGGGFTPTLVGTTSVKVCNSGTWLKQYAPFQDLKANATCTEVAAYVTNVIKAANASGASMNAMLKAQMLATALDTYFSDPALGGNKIGAPAPLGGVEIDLTKVCSNIATCTNYVDAGPAFGGADSLTVSQILAYAASRSNVGGSTWYGNVKATQELAKDTFDAINNQVAFGA